MKIPNPGVDAVKLRYVPFSLKDLAKKWLYNLEVGSISSWDNFIKTFLKKFYPIHKTAQIRESFLQFKQTANVTPRSPRYGDVMATYIRDVKTHSRVR